MNADFSRSSYVSVTTPSPINSFFLRLPTFALPIVLTPLRPKKVGRSKYLGKIGNHRYAIILLFGSWGDKEREGGRGGAGKVHNMGIAGMALKS